MRTISAYLAEKKKKQFNLCEILSQGLILCILCERIMCFLACFAASIFPCFWRKELNFPHVCLLDLRFRCLLFRDYKVETAEMSYFVQGFHFKDMLLLCGLLIDSWQVRQVVCFVWSWWLVFSILRLSFLGSIMWAFNSFLVSYVFFTKTAVLSR